MTKSKQVMIEATYTPRMSWLKKIASEGNTYYSRYGPNSVGNTLCGKYEQLNFKKYGYV